MHRSCLHVVEEEEFAVAMEVIKEYCTNAASYSLGQMRKKLQSLQDALTEAELPSPAAIKSLVSKLGEIMKFRWLSCLPDITPVVQFVFFCLFL